MSPTRTKNTIINAQREFYFRRSRYEHWKLRELEVDVIHDFLQATLEKAYYPIIKKNKRISKTFLTRYWKTIDNLIKIKKQQLITKAKLPMVERDYLTNFQKFILLLRNNKR